MPKCPFATFKPISGPSGSFLAGPFRIVHHTTEGSTSAGAEAAYKAAKADPHFTVDGAKILQHIDTSMAARALRHPAGTIETNRHSAIQIELVGFAGKLKSKSALTNLARLCRWIEENHGNIPRVWPAGPPKPATAAGKDPGGHNRSTAIWASKGGHYGHSQVPVNTHFDPGYTKMEADFILNADFGTGSTVTNRSDPLVKPLLDRTTGPAAAAAPIEPIEGHFDDAGEPDE
jgi:hypothetical protein